MKIIFNGQEKEFNNCSNVAQILEQLDTLPNLFVVEKNQNIVYKEDYETESVCNGDSIELVSFTGGG